VTVAQDFPPGKGVLSRGSVEPPVAAWIQNQSGKIRSIRPGVQYV